MSESESESELELEEFELSESDPELELPPPVLSVPAELLSCIIAFEEDVDWLERLFLAAPPRPPRLFFPGSPKQRKRNRISIICR